MLLGLVNAFAAVLVLYVVDAVAGDEEFGWFAYAPLNDVVVTDRPFPWAYVVLPLSLLALNALLVPLMARRGSAQS